MAQITDQEYAIAGIDEICPHPDNPRRGDTAAIAASIQAHGFYSAVVAQRSTGFILAGNHRWEAAKRVGLATIPVFWLDCSDSEARRILLADNRTNDLASYSDETLARLLTEISAESGGLGGTGYTQEAFDAIVKSAGDAILEAQSGNEDAGGGDRLSGGSRCPMCGGPARRTPGEMGD